MPLSPAKEKAIEEQIELYKSNTQAIHQASLASASNEDMNKVDDQTNRDLVNFAVMLCTDENGPALASALDDKNLEYCDDKHIKIIDSLLEKLKGKPLSKVDDPKLKTNELNPDLLALGKAYMNAYSNSIGQRMSTKEFLEKNEKLLTRVDELMIEKEKEPNYEKNPKYVYLKAAQAYLANPGDVTAKANYEKVSSTVTGGVAMPWVKNRVRTLATDIRAHVEGLPQMNTPIRDPYNRLALAKSIVQLGAQKNGGKDDLMPTLTKEFQTKLSSIAPMQ